MAEYWDLYDCNRRPTGEIHRRGKPVPENRYHLVVQVWVRNDAGEFLISRRHPDKPFGMHWECTGGSVTSGEDSITGALREVNEELGIRLVPEDLALIRTECRECYRDFVDNYTARWNGSLSELKLQETEVVDAKWVTFDELCAIDAAGELVPTLKYFREQFASGR